MKVLAMNRRLGRWSAPKIVIHAGRRRLRAIHLANARARFVTQTAGNHDFAEVAGADPFNRFFDRLAGAALRARLHDPFVFARRLNHFAPFPDVVTDRLLHVNVLARLHGQNRGERMPVVRCRDADGVEVLQFEQFADVREAFDLFVALAELLDGGVQDCFVNVAQRDDAHIFLRQPAQFGDVVLAAPAEADDGHADFVIGARHPRPRIRRQADCGGGEGGAFEETSAVHCFHKW